MDEEIKTDQIQIDEKQRKKAEKEARRSKYDISYIPVLDGIRAVSVLIVVWFHFWQQSWLMPIWGDFNIDWIPRNGSILVDMMILLSGFCLFLPHAKEMVYGDKTPGAGIFYQKRVARIAPSYFVCIFLVLFCFALPLNEYATTQDMWKDLVPHMFFTHNLFPASTQFSKLNGALWTVGVEMQLYLIFPLVVKFFKKKPFLTYAGMVLIGWISCTYISKNFDTLNHSVYLNHTLTFFGVFANGMMGAWAYMSMTKNRTRTKAEEALFLLMAIAGMWLFKLACEDRMRYQSPTQWQVDKRFLLSLLFLFILFSIIMAGRYLKWLFGNRVMKFLAGISFNLYIWHQFIAVRLKEFRIPYWEGDTPPNQTGDKQWMWTYMILCIVISVAFAILMTYAVEKPLAKLIMKIGKKKRELKE